MNDKKIQNSESVTVDIKEITAASSFEEIEKFNVDAFTDTPGVDFKKSSLKKLLKDDWKIFVLSHQEEIVSVLFIKKDPDRLLTKNTPIKMSYQGNGLSHLIKEFYEEYASEEKIGEIIHYCPIDNFRMISLNEKHGYAKIQEEDGLSTWKKIIS